jgi:hypothetical protein
MIKPCWFWMKRHTAERALLTLKEELEEAWIKYWIDMPREKIQA